MNARLADHYRTIQLPRDGRKRCMVAVVITDPSTTRTLDLLCNYCPFCGQKYPTEAGEAAEE